MRVYFLFLALLLLVACKSTTLTSVNSGVDASWEGVEKAEVLVAMRMESPSIRALFEDEMVSALEKEGIYAVASHTVMPSIATLTSESFTAFLSGGPQLAVLFSQASVVSKHQTSSQESDSSFLDNLVGGKTWETTFVARMEDALYVHGRTNAVWWNRVKVEADEKKLYKAAEEYVANEIKLLKQSGVIELLK